MSGGDNRLRLPSSVLVDLLYWTMATNTRETAVASLHTVVVTEITGKVELKWDTHATAASLSTDYSVAPYSFVAVDTSGNQPFVKTFGSLLYCDGGFLTIADVRYRIEVSSPATSPELQRRNHGKSRCCSRILVSNVLFEYGNKHNSLIESILIHCRLACTSLRILPKAKLSAPCCVPPLETP